MRIWQGAVLATAIAAGAAAIGLRACPRRAEPEVRTQAARGSVDDVDFAPYLATAHAIVTHAPRPAVVPEPLSAGRVFVTGWIPGHEPIRATGLGKTLADSVVTASEIVATTVPAGASVRVEIDVITGAEDTVIGPNMVDREVDLGLHGYLGVGSSSAGFFLPIEVVEDRIARAHATHGIVQLREERVVKAVAERAHIDPAGVAAMTSTRFTIAERIEAAEEGRPPIVLMRGVPLHPKELSPDALISGVRAGAEYLARSIDERGAFAYLYDPTRDEVDRSYELLRHAGAIFALMEAYEELQVPAWKDKAKLAIGYLKSRLVTTADGSYFTSVPDEEQQKVGACGLGLIALSQYERATGDRSLVPTMRDLARFILHQQYPDGHLRQNADLVREGGSVGEAEVKKEVYYYAGEATLGLVRMHAIEPQAEWIGAARKAADYLVNVRDANDDLQHQIQDHWLSYALHDLYVLDHEARYATHAHKIAEAIALAEKTSKDAPHPDYVGAFYEQGETAPTSARLEAVASTMQLARFMGTDEAPMRQIGMQLACFTRGQQLDADSAYFAKNPARAIGGVRRGLLRSDVRIDFVQHAMSGWLRLARLLRDPAWGKPRPAE
jgi:hypothetical protein